MALTMHNKEFANKQIMDSSKYVRYTPEQVEALERVYTECPKPSSLRRQQLIRECPILSNIEPKQIKVWFQNRRWMQPLSFLFQVSFCSFFHHIWVHLLLDVVFQPMCLWKNLSLVLTVTLVVLFFINFLCPFNLGSVLCVFLEETSFWWVCSFLFFFLVKVFTIFLCEKGMISSWIYVIGLLCPMVSFRRVKVTVFSVFLFVLSFLVLKL